MERQQAGAPPRGSRGSPAGHVAEDAVVEERVPPAVGGHLQGGDAGGVVVDHHDAGAVEPLGLVHQQVAPLVVHVVGDHEALCGTKRTDSN